MLPGKIGRYEIKREIGRGGMSTVYQAYDAHLQREVAIKVLPRAFSHALDYQTRFAREARVLAELEHPAIVPVYDFGIEDEQSYIVMRLLSGGSLRERLQDDIPLLEDTNNILRRIAEAIDFAHSKGVIHRDLKPGNVLFDNYGNAFLSDFGIARLGNLGASVTATGAFVGTPAYMSPEQIQGAKDADEQSDIYSLGVLVFEMLSGRTPYQADTPFSLALKHVTESTPSLHVFRPDLPKELDLVLQKVLSKNPAERFSTAKAFAEAFDASLKGYKTQLDAPAKKTIHPEREETSDKQTISPTKPFHVRFREWVASWRSKAESPQKESNKFPKPPLIQPVDSPLGGEMTFNLIAALSPQSQKQIITLIGRDHELRLKDLIVHFGGGRYVLRGFGRFGATALVDQLIESAKHDLMEFYGEDNSGAILAIRMEFPKSQVAEQVLDVLVRELRLEVLRGEYSRDLKGEFTKLYKSYSMASESSTENTFSFKVAPIPGIEASFARKAGKTSAKGKEKNIASNSELVNVIRNYLDKSEIDNSGVLEKTIGRLLNTQNIPSRVIFIIDRVESEEIFTLLQNLRLFDDPRITFFVIVPQEQYLQWSQDTKRIVDKLSFRSHYIPCLWEEKTNLIDQIIFDTLGTRKKNSPQIEDFKNHVAYVSRGAPGDAVREILSYENTSFQFKVPKLMVEKIRNKKIVLYNARRQKVLAQNWDEILGHRFISEEEIDQAKVGCYEVMDWIHDMGGFKLSTLKEAAASAFVPVSISVAKRENTLEALLKTLIENHYLTEKGEKYQVVYASETSPQAEDAVTREGD